MPSNNGGCHQTAIDLEREIYASFACYACCATTAVGLLRYPHMTNVVRARDFLLNFVTPRVGLNEQSRELLKTRRPLPPLLLRDQSTPCPRPRPITSQRENSEHPQVPKTKICTQISRDHCSPNPTQASTHANNKVKHCVWYLITCACCGVLDAIVKPENRNAQQ